MPILSEAAAVEIDSRNQSLADCEAALPGASKCGVGNDFRRGLLIGVGQHDDVILGAALALHTLAACRSARVNVLGDWR